MLTWWLSIGLKITFSKDLFGLTSDLEFSKKLQRVEFTSDTKGMKLNYYRFDSKDKKPINQDTYRISMDGSLIPTPKNENPEHHLDDLPKRIKEAIKNYNVA